MTQSLTPDWSPAAIARANNWSERGHRGSRRADSHWHTGPFPRTFAEFSFTKTWQEIAIYTQRLNGVSCIGLFGEGNDSWLRFAYKGESFGIQDGSDRLTLTVDDGRCPDAVLTAVQSHFAPLLSSHLKD